MAQSYGNVAGHKEHHSFKAKHHRAMAQLHEKAAAHHEKMSGATEDGDETLTDGLESDNEDTVQNHQAGKLPMSFGRGAR